jgi:hypothetical protein
MFCFAPVIYPFENKSHIGYDAMSLREEAPSARLWTVERAILPAARAPHIVPKGCICSINAMRTLSVAHIGLSGERTDVAVGADLCRHAKC